MSFLQLFAALFGFCDFEFLLWFTSAFVFVGLFGYGCVELLWCLAEAREGVTAVSGCFFFRLFLLLLFV